MDGLKGRGQETEQLRKESIRKTTTAAATAKYPSKGGESIKR